VKCRLTKKGVSMKIFSMVGCCLCSTVIANTLSFDGAYLVWKNDHYLKNIQVTTSNPFKSSGFFSEPWYEVTKSNSIIQKIASKDTNKERKEEYYFDERSMLIRSVIGSTECKYEYSELVVGTARAYVCTEKINQFLMRRVQHYNKKGLLIRDESYDDNGKMLSYRLFDYQENIVSKYNKGTVQKSSFDIDEMWHSRNVD
jgi:hypothetical protein